VQVLSVRIDDAMVHEFKQVCDGLGTNRADFIRTLIRQAIDDPKRAAAAAEIASAQAADTPGKKDTAEARDFAFAAAAMSFFVLYARTDPHGLADLTLESVFSSLPSGAAKELRRFVLAFSELEERRSEERASSTGGAH